MGKILENMRAQLAQQTFIAGEDFNFRISSRAQVWVETVIYTLIGLAIIGILLAAATPQINATKDKVIIEQTIDTINQISSRVYDVQIAPGNKRILSLKITKGTFYVNSSNNEISWVLDSSYKYSEIGKQVSLGGMRVLTTEGAPYTVSLYMNYTINLTYAGQKSSVSFEESPTPYTLTIENKGLVGGNINNIDLVVA